MAKKQKKSKKKDKKTKQDKIRQNKTKALTLVVSDVQYTPQQKAVIETVTLPQFIKKRKGKGGKEFTYVEVGYIISRLNEAFALNWDFEIIREEVVMYDKPRGLKGNELGEVWIKGKLIVKDFKTGYRVEKTQFGGHTVYTGVLIADSLKSAASDCLKKCSSLFGFALDVYWQVMEDEGEKGDIKESATEISEDQLVKSSIELIKRTNSIDLLLQMAKKLQTTTTIKSPKNKEELKKWINSRLDQLSKE